MDPFRAIQYAGEIAHLTIAFRAALTQHEHPGIDPRALAELVANEQDVQEVWAESADFPKRDYMTFCAEHAHRAGVTAETLGDWLRPGARYAVDLLELAAEQVTGAADPSASLLPEDPTAVMVGPTGIYAVGTVCDSTEPEADKIFACALLNAHADHLAPASPDASAPA